MGRKTFTWRTDADLLEAASLLSKTQNCSVNAFITAAVEARIAQTAPGEAEQLERIAQKLRALPNRKEAFNKAKAAFVEHEASQDDPAEGKSVELGLDDALDRALRA